MLQRRLRALEHFQNMPMPTDWPEGPDLSEVDVSEIVPYIRPDIETRGGVDDWTDLPDDIKDTFDKLGIPEAEKNALSGVGAQYESEIVYQNMQEQWEEKGVIFCDMDKAVRDHGSRPGALHEQVCPTERQQVRRAPWRDLVWRLLCLRTRRHHG